MKKQLANKMRLDDPVGCLKKHFKDILKASLKAFKISYTSLEQTAEDRDCWGAPVHQGAKSYEANRVGAAEQC